MTEEHDLVPSSPDALFDVHDIDQDGDRVSARMWTGPRFTGPDGRPAVGGLGVLVDNVLGYAIMASLPRGSWSISTEIWIDLIGPIPGDGSRLHAEAAPLQAGAFSVGRVVDDSGRLVAECRQRGRRVSQGPARDQVAPQIGQPAGVDTLGALIGLRSDGATHALEMTSALANPRQMLHGGVSLAASEIVATASRLECGSSLATTSIHIVHTRGVAIGSRVEFAAINRHSGRSLWLTDVVGTVEGKVCTTTRVTAQR